MRKQLIDLRSKMTEYGIDIYIIPTTDYHGSEYVNDYFKCREYVSGFTGSAGTLIVSQDFAGLWTDGRYFIQAAQQLEGSGIELMKMGEEGVPTIEGFLDELHARGTAAGSNGYSLVVGFDGRVIDEALGSRLESKFSLVHDVDLVGEIWEDRPEIKPSEIYKLPDEVTGESVLSKLARVRQVMGGADYLLLSSLEEIAWLYNLRGADIAYTPVFYAFSLISRDEAVLYVMDEDFKEEECCIVKRYDEIYEDLKALRDCTLQLDQKTVSYALSRSFDESVKTVMAASPVEMFKAVKNETEIAATRNAHIRDGAAMAEFICWLKKKVCGDNVSEECITEISAADHLEKCRRDHGAYDLSFNTIAGYEEHGAIIHYAATEESDCALHPEGFILVDSGGQYRDGTTDITRTIALGPVSPERKKNYTAVLKGHIALVCSEFRKGTTGLKLDEITRKPLRKHGLEYNHGTGHGVGHMLSVHEGPNTISLRGSQCCIEPGMINSNEPGVYLEGQYGIRIENEILCVAKGRKYGFENLTFCPYEREAIDVSMLTAKELAYINEYHQQVYEKISLLVDEEVKTWLKEVCQPL